MNPFPYCSYPPLDPTSPWLGLMIGNSRLHWGHFQPGQDPKIWDTPHRLEAHQLPYCLGKIPLVLASVVPELMNAWLSFEPRILTVSSIPLKNTYASLGVDRALAAWGAGVTYGFPCLVIDGGTALTLTAVDDQANFWGGAILPGLSLQFQSLGDRTAALPTLTLSKTLPPRWATNTPEAISSGVIYTVLAGLQHYLEDWWQQFPQGTVVVTGGDEVFLRHGLEHLWGQDIPGPLIGDRQVIFRGMEQCVTSTSKENGANVGL